MPSAQTETTELAVAFGLLDREPQSVAHVELANLFRGTLLPDKFDAFCYEFYRDQPLYRRFYSIGVEMRVCYPPFETLESVRWEGWKRQARRVVIPKDIVAANTPISIKDTSNLVSNSSPYRLLLGLPKGELSPARAANWYMTTALDAYQQLYMLARTAVDSPLPEDVRTYHQRGQVKDWERRDFADQLDQLSGNAILEFRTAYEDFCRTVAIKSAADFNEQLALTLGSNRRNAVEDSLLQEFFRAGDTSYIICGSDKGRDFALEVPDLTSIRRSWKFKRLVAHPDLTAGQSKVRFDLVLSNKRTNQECNLLYWAEIRWSHHKFYGSPEAKLYKQFRWADVPLFNQLYVPGRVQKIATIGSGGFGTVYVAKVGASRELLAVKELRIPHLRREGLLEESLKRFKREITLQAQVKHPNIMPILDSDLDAPSPWFATELAQHTLADILSEFPSDFGRINYVFGQLLEGLNYAHAHGLIHRDIKPSNIFLFEGDLTRLGDFGLVKANEAPADSTFVTGTSDNSMGSFPYAAPEQLDSLRNATCQSDIYAVGVTLYAMLLGYESPTISKIETLDPQYCEFIKKCIAPQPEDRFATTAEAIQSFSSFA